MKKTYKDMFKRYSYGMDVLLYINVIGVYFYCCIFGTSDVPTVMFFAGLNTAVILITRFNEIKKDMTPKSEKSEAGRIIRRVK